MKKKLLFFSLLIFIFIVFHVWFGNGVISGGDLWVSYADTIKNDSYYPLAWYSTYGNGIGDVSFPSLGIEAYYRFVTGIYKYFFGFNFSIIERIFFLWPFLIFSACSAFYLAKKMLKNTLLAFFSIFIFLFNTYTLMLAGGGQMGVALGFSLSPMVLCLLISTYDNPKGLTIRTIVAAGLLIALQSIFDLRMFIITLFAFFLYWLMMLREGVDLKKLKNSLSVLFSVIFSILLLGFWFLPQVISKTISVPQNYVNSDWLSYLSFANFSDSISLLHPNWPDNIFGKIYLMRPLFLFVPILAFSFLIIVNLAKNFKASSEVNRRHILFFGILGLIGAFMAKGVNEPFGDLYALFYKHLPGFIIFRDPTKWYVLIVISYSILIPYSVSVISKYLKKQKTFVNNKVFNLQNLFVFFIIVYLLFLIRPAFMGKLGGTFKRNDFPLEYFKLSEFLSQQKDYYRILSVPTIQRFVYSSDLHPAISAQDLFHQTEPDDLIKKLMQPDSRRLLSDLSVKYLLVPNDTNGEIFLTKRKYDENKYQKLISQLDSISFLTNKGNFGKIVIYENLNYKPHFWIQGESTLKDITFTFHNSTKYTVNIRNAKAGDRLVFAERFNSGWEATGKQFAAVSIPYNELLNSFTLPISGNYDVEIEFKPQKWVNIGLVMGGTIIVVTGIISIAILILNILLKHPSKFS